MEKKLYKSKVDKKLAGVCGGVAEYFGLDPTLVRLGYAVLVLFAGTGLLLYIVCAFIMPEKPM
jgi:phage shock protein C